MVAANGSKRFFSARWVLPIASDPVEHGVLEVQGERIAAVHQSDVLGRVGDDAQVIDCGEAIIMPGLINLHTHVEYTEMRGFDTQSPLFRWIPGLMQGVRGWQPTDFRSSALSGVRAIAGSGTTCVFDSSYTGQAAFALAQAGLRAVVGMELFGLDESQAEVVWQRWLDRRQELIDSCSRADADDPAACSLQQALQDGRIILTVAPHAPYTVSPALLKIAVAWARANRLPLTMHLAESEHEYRWVEIGDESVDGFLLALHGVVPDAAVDRLSSRAAGCSPVELARRHGALGGSTVVAHAVHLNQQDVGTLAETATAVAHCPRSNSRLRNGISPLPQLLQAGVNVGFGTDSAASNDDLNLLAEARFAWNLHRAHHPAFAGTAESAVYMLTAGAAKAIGLSHMIGTLEEGKMADIAIFNLSPGGSGQAKSPYDLLLYGEPRLRDLYVAGRHVLNNAL